MGPREDGSAAPALGCVLAEMLARVSRETFGTPGDGGDSSLPTSRVLPKDLGLALAPLFNLGYICCRTARPVTSFTIHIAHLVFG